MGGRIDELEGRVKRLGALTGTPRLEAEDAVQAGVARAKRKTRGVLHEAGGAVQAGLGKLTGDLATQAKGTANELRGKSERTG